MSTESRHSLTFVDTLKTKSYHELYPLTMLIDLQYIVLDKVFKNGPGKIGGWQALKNLKWYGLLKNRSYISINFLCCLPQISLGSFVNILS